MSLVELNDLYATCRYARTIEIFRIYTSHPPPTHALCDFFVHLSSVFSLTRCLSNTLAHTFLNPLNRMRWSLRTMLPCLGGALAMPDTNGSNSTGASSASNVSNVPIAYNASGVPIQELRAARAAAGNAHLAMQDIRKLYYVPGVTCEAAIYDAANASLGLNEDERGARVRCFGFPIPDFYRLPTQRQGCSGDKCQHDWGTDICQSRLDLGTDEALYESGAEMSGMGTTYDNPGGCFLSCHDCLRDAAELYAVNATCLHDAGSGKMCSLRYFNGYEERILCPMAAWLLARLAVELTLFICLARPIPCL